MARKVADRAKGSRAKGSEAATGPSARLRANRANAKRSTGPRSAAGKAKSAANALRHGLATPPGAVAELGPQIASLARRLAGEGADESLRQCAGLAAEAQIDLLRIRAARDRLLLAVEAALSADVETGLRPADARLRAEEDAVEQSMRGLSPRLSRLYAGTRSTGSGALAPRLRELASLERYERRAFSRRRRALRALSEMLSEAE